MITFTQMPYLPHSTAPVRQSERIASFVAL